jgi:hypothetical protein
MSKYDRSRLRLEPLEDPCLLNGDVSSVLNDGTEINVSWRVNCPSCFPGGASATRFLAWPAHVSCEKTDDDAQEAGKSAETVSMGNTGGSGYGEMVSCPQGLTRTARRVIR